MALYYRISTVRMYIYIYMYLTLRPYVRRYRAYMCWFPTTKRGCVRAIQGDKYVEITWNHRFVFRREPNENTWKKRRSNRQGEKESDDWPCSDTDHWPIPLEDWRGTDSTSHLARSATTGFQAFGLFRPSSASFAARTCGYGRVRVPNDARPYVSVRTCAYRYWV